MNKTRYWKEDMCWIKGNLKSRKIDAHLFDEVKQKKQRKSKIESKRELETRNLMIGWQKGLDFFSHIAGFAVLNAVNKAT